MRYRFRTLAGLLVVFLALVLSNVSEAEQTPDIMDLAFSGAGFPSGTGIGYAVTDDGLTLAESSLSSDYLSPVLTAPIYFNAIIPQWAAENADEAQMEIQLRTAKTPGDWSEWFDIHIQPDWMLPGDTNIVGGMIAVPSVDVTHRYIQFSISFERMPGAPAPLLRDLWFTLIDSTDGPTAEEMVAQQEALDQEKGQGVSENGLEFADNYPRPTVVSRNVWCTHSDCNYSSGISYAPATNMVIHHTVSSNSSSDWAAVVRAIWRFHTYPASASCSNCRGWGDIGYNYLVDRNGVIYEGHNNADYYNLDVIGTHAGDANAGGLGVSLIGTYTSPEEYPISDVPPAPMLESAAKILAWKADQRNIDVYGATRMVNMSWGLPNVMGHRDVYGGTATTCPGGEAHKLLPWLRDRAAELSGFESPHIYIDELSSAFSKSNANWYEGPRRCGNDGHSYYTWSTTDPAQSTNWAEWRPTVPASGRYEIEVYAPYCDTGKGETRGATYRVTHANGTDSVVVNQNDSIGLWMKLGEFDLYAGTSSTVYLSDLTTTDSGRGVWFDAIRLRQLPPTATNVAPLNNKWMTSRTVDFSWTISSPSLVQGTTIQMATDPAFANIFAQKSWSSVETNYTHTFGQDRANVYWRILLLNSLNAEVTSPASRIGVDTAPPVSAIANADYFIMEGTYELFWGGTDAGSGVSRYHIDYRADNESGWTRWLSDTTLTNKIFTPPDVSKKYWFRSQAVDVLGNLEPVHVGNGDLNSDQATVIFTPAARNQAPAQSLWLVDRSVTFSWNLTEITDVQTSTLQVATDASFNSLLFQAVITGNVTSHTADLTQDGEGLYWKVTVEFTPPLQSLTSVVVSPPTSFGIDTAGPTSAVSAIYSLPNAYYVAWSGTDVLSGVARYHVDYQLDGFSNWYRWLTDTSASGGVFKPPISGEKYWFRTTAIDVAGNEETPPVNGTAHTGQANPFPYAIMLPVTAR